MYLTRGYNSTAKNNRTKKGAEALNRHFSKDDKQAANRDMKRCPTLLTTRGMKTKTTMIYQLIPVRMAIIRDQK